MSFPERTINAGYLTIHCRSPWSFGREGGGRGLGGFGELGRISFGSVFGNMKGSPPLRLGVATTVWLRWRTVWACLSEDMMNSRWIIEGRLGGSMAYWEVAPQRQEGRTFLLPFALPRFPPAFISLPFDSFGSLCSPSIIPAGIDCSFGGTRPGEFLVGWIPLLQSLISPRRAAEQPVIHLRADAANASDG